MTSTADSPATAEWPVGRILTGVLELVGHDEPNSDDNLARLKAAAVVVIRAVEEARDA